MSKLKCFENTITHDDIIERYPKFKFDQESFTFPIFESFQNLILLSFTFVTFISFKAGAIKSIETVNPTISFVFFLNSGKTTAK